MTESKAVKVWRLMPECAEEWREIRLASLLDAPAAFDATFAEWKDRPLPDFAARLANVPTFAAGTDIGHPMAVACWQSGLDPRASDRAWLLSVFALAEARGRGFAEAAIRAALTDARAAGMNSAGLHVVAENVRAQRLYRRMGFVETGREGICNSRGASEVEMLITFNPRD